MKTEEAIAVANEAADELVGMASQIICPPRSKVAEKLNRQAEAIRLIAAEVLDLRERIGTGSDRVLRCAFCGQAYPPGTPETQADALTAHVRECKRHPLRAEIEGLVAGIRRAATASSDPVVGQMLRDILRTTGGSTP